MRKKIDLNYLRKPIIQNFFSLSVLQGFNFILPLMTFPYLVRVLGIEYFGLLAFATAMITYFNIITDYGFNMTATKEISVHRDNKQKVIEIFSSVMTIKFFLMICSFVSMSIIVFSFEKFFAYWEVYLFTFGIVIGQMFFPVWFFQGIEKMKYITYINVVVKSIFTIAIFVFIQEKDDFYLVPIINSLGFIVSGVLALLIIKKEFELKFELQKISTLKVYIKDAYHIFIGTIGISFYKNNSILILGLFADNAIVGYFSVAKKTIDAINQFAALLSQAIYPYVSRQVKIDIYKTKSLLTKIALVIGLYTFVFGMLILFFSEDIIGIISGQKYQESIISLQIMAFVPLFIGINVPAVQLLLSTSNNKHFSNAVLLGALLDMVLNFLLVPNYSYIGSCISIVSVELFVTIVLYYKVYQVKKEGNLW